MKTLQFYGASDNLFEVEGPGIRDEIGCYDRPGIYKVISNSGRLFVIGEYAVANEATWMVGVQQADEDIPLPAWPIRFVAKSPVSYSPMLELDVPDDTIVIHG